MARKTFISYKYSDVVEGKSNNLRDRIIAKLGDASRFYRGENGYSQDLSSRSADYIKTKLEDMIRDTSVTIAILSPNMKFSNWINWEIAYSLTGNYTRKQNVVNKRGCMCCTKATYILQF